MNLLYELESGKLEKKCSLADLKRVNQLIVRLAREGFLADDFDEKLALEEDIAALLYEEVFNHLSKEASNVALRS